MSSTLPSQVTDPSSGDGIGPGLQVGGAAMICVASVLPMLRPLAFVGSLPIIRAVVEPTYRLIAANRHRISRLPGDDACRIEPDRP